MLLIAFKLCYYIACVSDRTGESLTKLWNNIINDFLQTWVVCTIKVFFPTALGKVLKWWVVNLTDSLCYGTVIRGWHPYFFGRPTFRFTLTPLCFFCFLKLFRKQKCHPVIWIIFLSDVWRTIQTESVLLLKSFLKVLPLDPNDFIDYCLWKFTLLTVWFYTVLFRFYEWSLFQSVSDNHKITFNYLLLH